MAQYPLNNLQSIAVVPVITDVTSAAITTSANTSGILPTNGSAFTSTIVVTVVGGTNPTYNVIIQQSVDNINWSNLYTFPTITTSGAYVSPQLPVNLGYIRYNQTIGGTTPSFTRSILRNQISTEAGNFDSIANLKTRSSLAETIYTQSTSNNTSTQLATLTSFTGAIESALSYPQVIISVRCDQAYTLTIDQYSDAAGTIQYSPSIIYTRSANVTFNQAVNLAGSYFRIILTNTSGSTTTTLFLESWLGILPTLPNLDNNGNLPVASNTAADGTPSSINITLQDAVSSTATGTNSQSIVTGVPTVGSVALFSLSSAEGVRLQVTGTFVATLVAEISLDGGTTFSPVMINQSGMNTFLNSFTAPILGIVNTSGCTSFRIRCTSFTSGTATVKVTTTANIGSVQMSNSMTGASAGVPVDRSGTATITSSNFLSANTSRGGWWILNTSNQTIYVNTTGAATVGGSSVPILPNQEYIPPIVSTGVVAVIVSSSTATFIAQEWNGVPSSQIGVANAGLVASGALPAAQSLSVVNATNTTNDVIKEWKATGVTGTPATVVGNILLQTIRNNGGTISVTWFNMSTSTLFTVAPSIASLTENLNNNTSKEYTANIAGTGYAIGEHLIQTIRNNGSSYQEVWFNTDQKTVLTTIPSQAQILANLGFSNNNVRPEWKAKKKWIAGSNANLLIASPFAWVVIRNTNTFPVRIISLDINLISTTAPSASVSAWNCNTFVSMYTGATSITGGQTAAIFNVPSYTNDGTIIVNSGATALGGTNNILCGYVQPIVSYIEGATAGFSPKSGVSYGHKWAEGLIIPSGAMLVIQNNNSFAGPVANTFSTWNAIITDEL